MSFEASYMFGGVLIMAFGAFLGWVARDLYGIFTREREAVEALKRLADFEARREREVRMVKRVLGIQHH